MPFKLNRRVTAEGLFGAKDSAAGIIAIGDIASPLAVQWHTEKTDHTRMAFLPMGVACSDGNVLRPGPGAYAQTAACAEQPGPAAGEGGVGWGGVLLFPAGPPPAGMGRARYRRASFGSGKCAAQHHKPRSPSNFEFVVDIAGDRCTFHRL